MIQTEGLQRANYILHAIVTKGGTITPRAKLELAIDQNLFWSRACFYAIERIADTVIFHRSEIHPDDPYVAVGHLAQIGNMLVTDTHGLVEELEDLIDMQKEDQKHDSKA